jgi:hypothetical protein
MAIKELLEEVEYLIDRWLGPNREKSIDEEEAIKLFIEDMKEVIGKYEEN